MERAGAALLSLLHDTRGFTAVFLALALAVLIGFSALGVETGLWYAIKRQNQSGADVAALSGAMEVAGGKPYQTDICPLAKLGAEANNFIVAVGWTCPASSPASQSDCTNLASGQMCVNNPPLFGAYAGASFPKHVEVILAQQQNGFLASLWQANVVIDTRAVAGPKSFDTCMIALNTSGTDLKNNGNATITLNNCSFASNSTTDTNPNYSVVFNGGVTMTAAAISTAGGDKITGSSNFISPPVTTHASAVPDPYAGQITVPPFVSLTPRTFSTGGILQPGLYVSVSNNAPMNFASGSTILCPGVYVLDGAANSSGDAFTISGNGTTVTMGTAAQCPGSTTDGVTIIATCSTVGCTNGGGFDVGGTGSNTPTVTLSAPTTSPQAGIPKRILFYQVASTVVTNANKGNTTLAGGSGVSLNGVVYIPAKQIGLQGNPNFGSCTELIAATFVVGGTPTMNAPLGTCGIITKSVSTLVLLE